MSLRDLWDYLLSLLSGKPTPPEPPDPPPSGEGSALLAYHNIERREDGQLPLEPDARLGRAAQQYAEVMAARGELSHDIGAPLAGRLAAVGFRYARAGENIAAGQRTPEEAVSAWMHSPGHRANVLGPYRLVGFGHAVGTRGVHYWCADYGTERVFGGTAAPPLHTPGPCGGEG